MLKYALKRSDKKAAKAYGRNLDASTKHAVEICRAISGTQLAKGKSLLEGLTQEQASVNGRYHTKTAQAILEIVQSAAANADFKGLDA
ncbi:MAG: 50S ribosomal protein L22, partial [Candidatus Aenigmarchaeota archaeon]|nr:50S ribosomal protein L22 [Candidatus Aenigmarchaeota archaeon]